MSTLLLTSLGLAAVGGLAEQKAATPSMRSFFVPVTPLVIIGTGFWALLHGFTVVGPARKNAIEAAKKDGEKDVEERYGLPNLYAQGTSIHARTFNCIQRSHQHIFETFTQTSISALVGCLSYPIATGKIVRQVPWQIRYFSRVCHVPRMCPSRNESIYLISIFIHSHGLFLSD